MNMIGHVDAGSQRSIIAYFHAPDAAYMAQGIDNHIVTQFYPGCEMLAAPLRDCLYPAILSQDTVPAKRYVLAVEDPHRPPQQCQVHGTSETMGQKSRIDGIRTNIPKNAPSFGA